MKFLGKLVCVFKITLSASSCLVATLLWFRLQWPRTRLILDFTKENNLFRCDLAVRCNKVFTYCSDAQGNYSCIDFVLMSDLSCLCSYTVIECGSNLSDHVPVIVGS